MSNQRPAGWYPDDTNYGQQRWWDGNQWTAQVAAPYQAGTGSALQAPEGTSPSTPQIWLIVAIYAATIVAGVAYPLTIDWDGYLQSAISDPSGLSTLGYIFTIPYFAVLFLSFFGWLGSVALAYFDGKALEARGVMRPFHWAFTFIPSYGPLIYLIGRSVVARRRTGTGIAPMWVAIALTVLGFILGFVAAVVMFNSMLGGFAYVSFNQY